MDRGTANHMDRANPGLLQGLHVVTLFVQSITQDCASADVPFEPVPRP